MKNRVFKASEHEVQASIIDALSEMGCTVNRTNSGLFRTADGRVIRVGRVGFPDLQGHRRDGKCFYLEIKRRGEKPTEAQHEYIRALRESGAIAGWADCIKTALKVVYEEVGNDVQVL